MIWLVGRTLVQFWNTPLLLESDISGAEISFSSFFSNQYIYWLVETSEGVFQKCTNVGLLLRPSMIDELKIYQKGWVYGFELASSRGHNRIKSTIPIISLFITLQVLTFKGTLPPYPSSDHFTIHLVTHESFYLLVIIIISIIISWLILIILRLLKKCQLKSLKIEMLKIEITFL